MRRAVLPFATVCLLIAGCEREPSFDERFEKADAETRQLQKEIDRELTNAEAGKGRMPASQAPR